MPYTDLLGHLPEDLRTHLGADILNKIGRWISTQQYDTGKSSMGHGENAFVSPSDVLFYRYMGEAIDGAVFLTMFVVCILQ